jgi:phosphotransferase system HPr (HPr) family protein
MKEYHFKVTDPAGLHARPVTLIAKVCMDHESNVLVSCEGKTANGVDALALMAMYVSCGQEMIFTIEGEDEEETYEAIKDILLNQW